MPNTTKVTDVAMTGARQHGYFFYKGDAGVKNQDKIMNRCT